MLRIVIALLLLTGSAGAQANKNVSYLCIEEIAGGLIYDQQKKRWEGTEFTEMKGKFLLRVTVDQTVQRKNIESRDEQVDEYIVSVQTLPGKPRESRQTCFKDNRSESVFEGKTFRCRTIFTHYVFDFQTGRFLLAHLSGFVSDDTGTPHIVGGSCTKVD